jgi:hypothetical protein
LPGKSKEETLARIAKAIKDSVDLRAYALNAMNTESVYGKANCEIRDVKPSFRHHVIIIDDVIYFLHAIGIPVLIDENSWEFPTSDNMTHSPVDILAVRILNLNLANQVKEMIWADSEKLIDNQTETRIDTPVSSD